MRRSESQTQTSKVPPISHILLLPDQFQTNVELVGDRGSPMERPPKIFARRFSMQSYSGRVAVNYRHDWCYCGDKR
jgi:hypothetical protein